MKGASIGLTHKHETKLEKLARDRHSSLLRESVNYGRKFFIELAPGPNVKKPLAVPIYYHFMVLLPSYVIKYPETIFLKMNRFSLQNVLGHYLI